MTKARQKRGMKDTLVILSTLADRNRFAPVPNLRNIMTGVKADNAVNVELLKRGILSSMTTVSKGSEQAVTLA